MAGNKDDRLLKTLLDNLVGDLSYDRAVIKHPELMLEIRQAENNANYLFAYVNDYKDTIASLKEGPSSSWRTRNKTEYEDKLKQLCQIAIKIDAANNKYPKLKAFAYTLAAIALVLIVTTGILAALPAAAGGSLFAAALAWSGLTAFVGGSVITAAGVTAGIGLLFSVALGGVAAGLTPQAPKDITIYSAIDDFVNKVCAETGIKKNSTTRPYYCFWSEQTVEIQGPDLPFVPQI